MILNLFNPAHIWRFQKAPILFKNLTQPCQAKNGLATSRMVNKSYMTPPSGQRRRNKKLENLALCESIDALI